MNPANPGAPTEQQRQQLENSLRMAQAEAELARQKMRAHHGRGTAERTLAQQLWRVFNTVASENEWRELLPLRSDFDGWLQAHKSWYDAEGELLAVQVAKHEGQAAVMQAMLDQINQVVVPPGGKFRVPN